MMFLLLREGECQYCRAIGSLQTEPWVPGLKDALTRQTAKLFQGAFPMPDLNNRESMAVQGWDSKPLGASGAGLGRQVTGYPTSQPGVAVLRSFS
jgi:hypothetical protein